MRRKPRTRLLPLGLALVLAPAAPACGPDPTSGGDGDTDEGLAVCSPGTTACEGFVWRRCADDGRSWTDVETCDGACDAAAGCVACRLGMHRCLGNVSHACTADGAWERMRDCDEWGSACGDDGFCDDTCAVPERVSDYRGCDYAAVALRNQFQPVTTVAIANPNDVEVHVELLQGEIRLETLVVEPHWIRPVELEANLIGWTHVGSGGVVRIRSDLPVVVTQYLPFESGSVWSADASLLLPSHSLGRRHRVASYLPLSYVGLGVGDGEDHWPARNVLASARGYVTIVGSLQQRTRVTVTPSAPLEGDPAGRVPATAAGETLVLDLAPGEAAQLIAAVHPLCDASRPGYEALGVICRDKETGGPCGEDICECRDDAACAETDYDLTGTLVESDHPVAVFGAHECAFLPFDRWACDHLQDQMPPLETWGKDHVSMTVGPGGGGGPNLVRILAAYDDTVVTLEPPQSGTERLELDAGEWAEVVADGIFRALGDRPILVAQYLWGQGMFLGPGLRGDPSFWIVPPVEQFRRPYDVGLPESYEPTVQGQNYLLIVRPESTWTAVDRVRQPEFTTRVAGWEAGVVAAGPGVHSVAGEEPFALIAVGLSEYTSYATPAGRGLSPILY